MSKKKLLSIHLNEFNLSFLRYGAKKFNYQNIKKLLKFKIIKTYSIDKVQDKNLDPWVQTVTINTGKSSNFHQIYKTGQTIPANLIQIWDKLSQNKIYCAVWGSMNTRFKDNSYIKIFFPDPWNKQDNVKPKILKNVFNLPRSYAKNYTDFNIYKNFKYIIQFFLIIICSIKFSKLFFISKLFLETFLPKGFKNYNLFFLFDVISLCVFFNILKKNDENYSHIFLNSLAHFQHNNWNEKNNHHIYFKYVDAICKIILENFDKYDQILIYNGFTQKKIKPEYLLRPKNPNKFLRTLKINFKKLSTNMTNGGILEFYNQNDLRLSKKKLKDFEVFGYNFFEVKNLPKNKIFFRIQVKSSNKINTNSSISSIKKYLSYDTNFKINLKKKITLNKNIFDSMKFIKTTGKHYFEGNLLAKKKLSNYKRIENKKIFSIVERFFLKK